MFEEFPNISEKSIGILEKIITRTVLLSGDNLCLIATCLTYYGNDLNKKR